MSSKYSNIILLYNVTYISVLERNRSSKESLSSTEKRYPGKRIKLKFQYECTDILVIYSFRLILSTKSVLQELQHI